MIDRLWPTVEKANAVAPSQAQLHRNYIMFAAPGKHLLRADKGSIKRRNTIEEFQDDIDLFYRIREDEYAQEALSSVEITSLESIRSGIRGVIARVLSVLAERVAPDEDIFGAGLDSLQVFIVIGALRALLQQGNAPEKLVHALKPQMVYSNPSVNKLSDAFFRLLGNKSAEGTHETPSEPRSTTQDVNLASSMLKKYTSNLPSPVAGPTRLLSNDVDIHVILTGSTGSLGSHLLDELLRQPRIVRITCLNRATDGKAKQLVSNAGRGLEADWPDARVQFLQADISQTQFGLPESIFTDLLQTANVIIRRCLA